MHFNPLLCYGNYYLLFKPALVYFCHFLWFKEEHTKLTIFVLRNKGVFFFFLLREELHWVNNYSFRQVSLNQSSMYQGCNFGGGANLFCCSGLLLSTAVVHTVMSKGVNIFIMFVKFILYNCRSRLLFCDIWDIMF